MSVVASPTQQGVVKSPNAAHLRTNVINGKVRIASSNNQTGAQNAVYHIVGGSITSNVDITLPNLTGDDTIATQGDNINWTGNHTFQQGLNAIGPITTSSSIAAGSVSATNLTATGDTSVIGDLNTNGDVTVQGTINPAISGLTTTTGGNMTVGSDLLVSGNHTVTSTSTLTGPIVAKGNATISFGGTDSAVFTFTTGATNGTMFAGSASQLVGFHNIAPSTRQNSHGAINAGTTYTTNEQSMLNDAYHTLRTKGFLT